MDIGVLSKRGDTPPKGKVKSSTLFGNTIFIIVGGVYEKENSRNDFSGTYVFSNGS